jgi:hypothetical protein
MISERNMVWRGWFQLRNKTIKRDVPKRFYQETTADEAETATILPAANAAG